MRWVVYGAGAVGGVLGGRLYDAGHDVVLVARGDHLRALRADGLTLASPEGTHTVRVPTAGGAAELDPSAPTVVLLAVKSHQTHAAVEDLTGVVDAGTPVVCVQNGVANEPFLLRFYADVQGVCVIMPTGHLEPGVVEQHSSPVPGILDVGRFPGGINATTERVVEAFHSAGFASEPRADVMAWKHRKLMNNLGYAVQACCGDGPGTAELSERARAEGEAVLVAAGIPVVTAEEDRARRKGIVRLGQVRGRPRAGDSSWQSLTRGTGGIESDYLNGEVVLLGRKHGVPTPANELLRATAQRMARLGEPAGSVPAGDLLAALS